MSLYYRADAAGSPANTGNNTPQNALTANPLLLMWTMPWLIAQSWMAAWISAGTRKDAVERNSDPGQLPVPPVHQDSHDKEIFA